MGVNPKGPGDGPEWPLRIKICAKSPTLCGAKQLACTVSVTPAENYRLFENDIFFTPDGEHSPPLKEPVKGDHRGRGDKRDSIGVVHVRGTPEVQPQPSGLEMMTGKSTFVS